MIADIAAAVRAGRVRAADVVAEALELAERAQPVLNAFTSIDRDGAMKAARAVDAAVADGRDPGPLAGVPVGVKDLIDQKGLPNTRGSSAPPPVAAESAPVVTRLEAAGAVVVGRTGLHEFAFGFSSENHWHGPVRNPWDRSLSPGGSSGGSGAAVAAGLVPLTLGTDTGGSVRVPAALCGVVGLKVTHGRVPLRGVYPLAPTLDTVGPIGRAVADCAAAYAVIAGDDPRDPWSLPISVEGARRPADLSRLRVGIPLPMADLPVAPAQREAYRRLLDGLDEAGADLVELDVPEFVPSPHSTTGLYFEVARTHGERIRHAPEEFGPEVRERMLATVAVTGEEFLQALEWRRAVLAATLRALGGVDVLATPTVAALRKTIGVETVDVAGTDTAYRQALATFVTPVNHIGLPALALPLPGTSMPPPSAQIIGPPWSERLLLEVGLGLEAAGLSSVALPPHWRPGEVGPNPGRGA